MNPPLRSEADRQATIAAIADGTVDLLATDHAPHTMEEKELGFLDAPNGIIGLECAYGVCHKVLVDGGFISDERLIELMSTGPARLMGHRPTDITALLNVTAPGRRDTKRVLDLSAVERPGERRSRGAEHVRGMDRRPRRSSTPRPATRHSADGRSPGARWRPSSAPIQLAFSRKPAVSSGTGGRHAWIV